VCITSPRTYAEAGVDVARVAIIQKGIETALSRTFQTRKGKLGRVLGIRGHYAAVLEISRDYALALHTDNVGTKVLVAEACQKYDTLGIDCVAMNVNDVICMGAEPLAMVDYLALEKPNPRLVAEIMKGLQKGGREAGVAIVGGETAIVPDIVRHFDLSGTVVGIVKKNHIITGEQAEPGDAVLGLASTGIHSNGLTLARKTLLVPKANPKIVRELLRPTRIYVKEISKLLKSNLEIHGLAHITGGAYSKLKRIGQRANVGFQLDNLPDPPWVFKTIQSKARVPTAEMYRTFNMGIGFLVVCPRQTVKQARSLIPGLRQVGHVTSSREANVMIKGEEISVTKY
jgi:phosphoribosylformylglycinamidine cyclo-ligase